MQCHLVQTGRQPGCGNTSSLLPQQSPIYITTGAPAAYIRIPYLPIPPTTYVQQLPLKPEADIPSPCSESTSIPKNPRTDRPVGYAFVDLSTPSEAERAIAELSGKEILDRKVSVQLARKPEQNAEKTDGATASGVEAQNGEEGNQRKPSGRGRGRGRGRGGRDRRTGGRPVSSGTVKYICQHTDILLGQG